MKAVEERTTEKRKQRMRTAGIKGRAQSGRTKKKKRKEEKRCAPTTKGKRFFSENRKKFVPNR